MAESENQVEPDIETAEKTEPTKAPVRRKPAKGKTVSVAKAGIASLDVSRPKVRGLSADEKLEKIQQIDAQVSNGGTLKEAVQAAGISDQTYYLWKKAVKPAIETQAEPVREDVSVEDLDELAELEAENIRLRVQLAKKLKQENAELRRRLGLE